MLQSVLLLPQLFFLHEADPFDKGLSKQSVVKFVSNLFHEIISTGILLTIVSPSAQVVSKGVLTLLATPALHCLASQYLV